MFNKVKSRFVSGKKVLFTLAAILCFSGAFAQEKSVAIVRHINMLGMNDAAQRLIVSRPDQEVQVIQLKQRYIDKGMNDQIAEDNQTIIKVFTEFLSDGYKLAASNSTPFVSMTKGFSTQSGGRETIYIFIKE